MGFAHLIIPSLAENTCSCYFNSYYSNHPACGKIKGSGESRRKGGREAPPGCLKMSKTNKNTPPESLSAVLLSGASNA